MCQGTLRGGVGSRGALRKGGQRADHVDVAIASAGDKMSTGMATDFSRQRFGEGASAQRAAKIGSALGWVLQNRVDGRFNHFGSGCEFRVPMFASEPIKQHGGGKNQGSGIGLVLPGNIRRGAVLRLRHARASRRR